MPKVKKNILVVDDDRVMLKFISKLLTREGHEVVTAEDGFAALNLLSTFTPDIMFFDLIMPKIDGGKLIQIVRNMPQLKDCYLVIISAPVCSAQCPNTLKRLSKLLTIPGENRKKRLFADWTMFMHVS